jgi:glutamate 5-kinase
MKIAQLLVRQRDFLEQQRWAEIRDTISACLEAGVVPVINENDTTNTAAGPAGQMFLRLDLKKSSA